MENPYAAPQGEIITPRSEFIPLTWKQILFSFTGRIPRRQYWAAIGIQFAVIFGVALIAGILVPVFNRGGEPSPALISVLVLLAIPFAVFAIWTGLAVGVKRWHDRGKSGWWMLLGFIPYLGGIWTLIECGCLRGTEGSNRFGEDPT